MQNFDEIMGYFKQDEAFNFKKFLYKILSKWHWFALFGFLGIAVGFLVNRYSEPLYKVESTVLVRANSNGAGVGSFFEGFDSGTSTNVQNHMSIIKSYSLNHQTLENLRWGTSYFKKELFGEQELYRNEPFSVIEMPGLVNITGVTLHITPLSEKAYWVYVNEETMINGTLKKIKLKQQGSFGEPFNSKYFNFTINWIPKREVYMNEEYRVRFNDINKQTLAYAQKLKVSLTDNQSDVIRIELKGNNPAKEVDYLNELCLVYIMYGLREKNQTSVNTVNFIDAQLSGIVDSLQVAGRNFTDFRSKNRVVDLGQEAELAMGKLEELESEKALVEMRMEYYKNLRNYLGSSEKITQMVAPSVVGITDPTLNATVLRLGELYSRREVLSYSVEDINPTFKVVESEIQLTRKSLEENLDNLLENSKIELRGLQQRINTLNSQLANLPKVEQELINIKRQFDLNNELYTFLLQKRAEAAITKASAVPDAKIIDSSRLDTAVKIGPKTVLNYIAGLILGLLLPFIFLSVSDFLNDTIPSREEVEKETKLAILGSVAHRPYAKELVVLDHPRSGISESYRGLRINLKFMLHNKEQKVIAIQSTMPGEGKSVTSTNMAAIIALNNKKVLLVDCDLRDPRLHDIFMMSNKTGMSTYLKGESDFNETIKESSVKNLDVAVGGPIALNPAELLESPLFEQFINKARELYDYVILDNSPVYLVTDGLLTGNMADVNLFLLREGHSKREQIKIINQLSESGTVKNIALIYNDARNSGFGYNSKYKGYNYGYGKGKLGEKHSRLNEEKRVKGKI